MKSINRIGFIVSLLTLGIVLVIYSLYWGTNKLLSHTSSTEKEVASTAPSPSVSPNALPVDNIKDIATGDTIIQPKTYTEKYLASLPTDLPRDQVLNKDKIAAFVEQQKGSLLPEIATDSIVTSPAKGKKAIAAYLDNISASKNTSIKAISSEDIQQAYQKYYADPQHSPELPALGKSLEQNVAALKLVAAPSEVFELHRQLLASSQALVDNVILLENTPTDFIGGLIGAKKIEDLGPVFQSIADSIKQLETKYKLS